MRRTKDWWGALTKEERSRLHNLEATTEYLSLGTTDRLSCSYCRKLFAGIGLCPTCQQDLKALIEKADNAVRRIKANGR